MSDEHINIGYLTPVTVDAGEVYPVNYSDRCANCQKLWGKGDMIRVSSGQFEPHHFDCNDPRLENVDTERT